MIVVLAALQLTVPLGLDAYLPAPEGNRLNKERAALGKRLFFEKALSRDGTVSCATCHDPARAYTDEHPVAVGLRSIKGTRRTPTIVNRAYGKSFFWDGRASTLEEQVLMPIENPKEMDLKIGEALERLRASGYGEIGREEVSRALANYVRTILAGDSPYDRFVAGDRTALTEEQQEGLRVFREKGNCASCHVGPNLTDERFHNTGVPGDDPGRYASTGKAGDKGAFKTPTLREVAGRGPYMHDGSLATLEDVIEHYDRGGRDKAGSAPGNLDPEMEELHLTEGEKKALAEFLRALTGVVREGF
ncbi:MAG: cytochrome c peroxidase [Bryobacteraceae bacterium]